MKEQLQEKLKPAQQEHVLAHWDTLSSEEQQSLAQQVSAIDFERLEHLFTHDEAEHGTENLASLLKPPPAINADGSGAEHSLADAKAAGVQALMGGKVGVVITAGGQGSRLGYDKPKAQFPIGPVSNHCLLRIFLEKVRATSARYGKPVPVFLMTSPATHEDTLDLLKRNANFGMPEADLQVFCQGTMPAVDDQHGKLLLAEKHRLFTNPDGHGGMLAAFERDGCLKRCMDDGIELIYYCQIDNPLARVCDPTLLGHHILSKSEVTTEAVRKQDPGEKVGLLVEVDGPVDEETGKRPSSVQIIEYSDLPEEIASERDNSGGLKYWAGNVAIHVFNVDFLARAAASDSSLPFHRAHKKVPHLDPDGNLVEPEEPNAYKFERFIFDLLPAADHAIVVEVKPSEAFAPVKNANDVGKDSPATSRAAMTQLHRGWLIEAGCQVADDVPVEISPLFALDVEQLQEKLSHPLTITEPTFLC